MKCSTTQFDNQQHEELFYMFISEFMSWSSSEYFIEHFNADSALSAKLLDLFPMVNCPEEFNSEIDEIHQWIPFANRSRKIIYRFEDN